MRQYFATRSSAAGGSWDHSARALKSEGGLPTVANSPGMFSSVSFRSCLGRRLTFRACRDVRVETSSPRRLGVTRGVGPGVRPMRSPGVRPSILGEDSFSCSVLFSNLVALGVLLAKGLSLDAQGLASEDAGATSSENHA